MRKHGKEIVRFGYSKEGTDVWYRHKNETTWNLDNNPTWDDDYIYIVDDKYASLRKESIDTGRPIQVKDSVTSEWITPSHELGFGFPLENYRLKPEKFKYPIYKENKITGSIVKFTGLTNGVVMKDTDAEYIGYKSDTWVKHTNTEHWEDVKEEKIKELENNKKFKYPLYKRNKITGAIVKFINETEGMFATWSNNFYSVENISGRFIKHTDTDVWEDVEYKESEPTYYYKWEKLHDSGKIIETANFVTDTYAENNNFKANGWRKIERSKRTWEEE